MALNAAALLKPRGMLTGGLFPEMTAEDLVIFLDTKLAEGYAAAADVIAAGKELSDAQQDDVARAWAYYQSYESIWQRVSASPATASIDGEASRTYLQTQIDAFEKLRNKYAEQYATLVAIGTSIVTMGVRSSAVRNSFVF